MKKRSAIFLAGSIYIFWGLTPIYWKLLKHVPPLELLANRILWGFFFVFPMFLGSSCRDELQKLFLTDWRSTGMIVMAALLIGWNWYNFVLAVITGRVLESSLAYFLTPLMVVLVGVVLLGERLNRAQTWSLVTAGSGILFLLVWLRQPPWLALILSSSFAVYGYLKTKVQASGAIGVGIENAILGVPAAIYLFRTGAHYDFHTWFLLLLSGPLTILPMIGYARVVKAIPYSTNGFLQYLSPAFQFFLAVIVYQEKFSTGHQVAFGFTWLALLIFTWDLTKRLQAARQMTLASSGNRKVSAK